MVVKKITKIRQYLPELSKKSVSFFMDHSVYSMLWVTRVIAESSGMRRSTKHAVDDAGADYRRDCSLVK